MLISPGQALRPRTHKCGLSKVRMPRGRASRAVYSMPASLSPHRPKRPPGRAVCSCTAGSAVPACQPKGVWVIQLMWSRRSGASSAMVTESPPTQLTPRRRVLSDTTAPRPRGANAAPKAEGTVASVWACRAVSAGRVARRGQLHRASNGTRASKVSGHQRRIEKKERMKRKWGNAKNRFVLNRQAACKARQGTARIVRSFATTASFTSIAARRCCKLSTFIRATIP